MSFLPSDYKEIPSTPGNFMKLEDGANNLRILSSAIVGYEYWNTDDKPVRAREDWKVLPPDIKPDKNGRVSTKHFWAFIVWNYDKKMIQLLELTQKTIMEGIKGIVDNPKWGDPKNFDITINRVTTGDKVSYTVMPNPHAPLDAAVASEYAKKPVNLEALYEGKDPFGPEAQTVGKQPDGVQRASQEVIDSIARQEPPDFLK